MRGLHELAISLGLTHLQLTIRDGQRLENFYGRFGYRVVGRDAQATRTGPGEYRDEVMLVAPVAKENPLEPPKLSAGADHPLCLADEGSTDRLVPPRAIETR